MKKPRPTKNNDVKRLGFFRPFRTGFLNERLDEMHRKRGTADAIGFLTFDADIPDDAAWCKRRRK